MAININKSIKPDQDNTYDIGTSSIKYANIYAYTFNGEATSATYADLAEKYTCGQQLEKGTVVVVAGQEEYDVEGSFADLCEAVVGVVSTKPAYLMNSQIEGEEIALTGRVPVRVVGKINKRDYIVPTENGCARAALTDEEKQYSMGICLESKPKEEEGKVECIIK